MNTNQEKHTPGPWKATRTDSTKGADKWWITANHERNMETEICEIIGGPSSAPHNAALIAAAPELLEALKRAAALAGIAYHWDLGSDGQIEIGGQWVDVLDLKTEFEAAIAKAEGRGNE